MSGARADTCATKKEARQLAWRWRSPPNPRREGGAEAPEEPDETPATQGEFEGEAESEVEMEVEPTPEGTEEEGWGRPVLFGEEVFSFSFVFSFLAVLGRRRRCEIPTMTPARCSPGAGDGYTCKKPLLPLGAAAKPQP